MLYADALDFFLLRIVQLIHVAIDSAQIDIFVKMIFEIISCSHLTHWLTESCYYKVA